jgi:hypothetical protein
MEMRLGAELKYGLGSLISIMAVVAIYRSSSIWPTHEGPSVDLHLRFVIPLMLLSISTNIAGWLSVRRALAARDWRFWTTVACLAVAFIFIGFETDFLSRVWQLNGNRAAL